MRVFAVGYLAVQGIVPLCLLWANPLDHNKDYSWDMFSHHLECPRVECVSRLPSGEVVRIPLSDDFASFAQTRRVLYPQNLPRYGERVCRLLRAQEGDPVAVYIRASCRDQEDGPLFDLVDPSRDYCAGASP